MPTDPPAATDRTAPLESAPSDGSLRHALILEDEEKLADMWQYWLQDVYGEALEVSIEHTVADGKTTLDSLLTLDLAILDRQLPDGTGDDLVPLVNDRFDPITVMITAVPPESDLIRLPIDDYLVKPIEKATLLNRVSLLEKLAVADALEEYSNARKASLLEYHLDDPEEDPLFRRFTARWSYDRLELADVGDRVLVYELYVGDTTGDEGEVSVRVTGSLDRGLEPLLDAREIKPVGQLVASGDDYAWIDATGTSRIEITPESIGVYRFTCDTPERYITDIEAGDTDLSDVELEAILESAFN